MKHITLPYLPEDKVFLFIADTPIKGACVIPPARLKTLPKALQKHADLGICVFSENKAVCPPDSFDYYQKVLSPYSFEIIKGKTSLDCHYPKDSAYNVCIVGKKCFLNKNVCDSLLFDILTSEGYEIINVKQGYTKCSICPIDENSIITADISIAKEAKIRGMDVLLVSNDGIVLDGYDNGFFGGCCGLGGNSTLLINGDIEAFPDGNAVRDFLSKRNMQAVNLKKGNLTDIGSIIPLMIK